jgi:hypothetical protein
MLKIVLAFVAAGCLAIWGFSYYQDNHGGDTATQGETLRNGHTREYWLADAKLAQTRLDCINGDLEKFQTHYCQGWLEKDGWLTEKRRQIIVKALTPHRSFHQRVVDYCVGQMQPVNYSQQIFQLQISDPDTQAEEVANRQKLRILESRLQHAVQSESDCEGYLLNGWTALPGEGEAPATKVLRQQALYDIQMGAGK